ncbi:MAG: orotidine-5'-phosphate decarboxylase [Deltaproteobacteria bacterium]|nr:orotidine-5'-phosphate decarboxylase [Deltaproteobacteria bacterium]MBW1922162.1 orotidine-5'-phosphate decarboxylase [Deltaproteobacteria bacterium]MBW1947979.1 orotidine-5'-phosphate decarboxylase [Deltaproteobacteria bacterium]MBW2007528.1 orotidine-5'-phosphate decarboxylase [Deltaproteobacteria bacterium]MBW2101665.1 orotidine-5'-phosphate decarboxylase [Deltaproteobacteria bacterium]
MKSPHEYIVFPLDLPRYRDAMHYVEILKDRVGLFKVGLELFISEGPRILEAIREAGGAGIFLDLKLHDIPATVCRALSACARYGPELVTVHCDGGVRTLETIASNCPQGVKILGVTVLTSLGPDALAEMGYEDRYARDVSSLVLLKAGMARKAGFHGVVCSGLEVEAVKRATGKDFIAVTPGIRPAWSLVEGDDQERIVTPAHAVRRGADYLVIGRPIRDASDPADAAARVADEIATAL